MVISLTATPQLPDKPALNRQSLFISHRTKSQPLILRRKNTSSRPAQACGTVNLLSQLNDLATINIYFTESRHRSAWFHQHEDVLTVDLRPPFSPQWRHRGGSI
jgi:hypothetical protein